MKLPPCIAPVHKGANYVPKAISDHDSDPFLIWKPDFTLCECKALSNQAFETWKRVHFGSWSAKKAWFRGHVNTKLFRNVIPSFANRPITSQCADPVRDRDGSCNACEWTRIVQITNPIRKADHDPKRLPDRDSLLCEQAHCLSGLKSSPKGIFFSSDNSVMRSGVYYRQIRGHNASGTFWCWRKRKPSHRRENIKALLRTS